MIALLRSFKQIVSNRYMEKQERIEMRLNQLENNFAEYTKTAELFQSGMHSLQQVALDHSRLSRQFEKSEYVEIKLQALEICSKLKQRSINLVLDVGANSGQYALSLIEQGYDNRIVSFEPLSSAYALLQKNASNYTNWEIADRCALGAHIGESTINISKNSYSSSILGMLPSLTQYAPEAEYISKEVVPITTLDNIAKSYFQADTKAFLKIDVQGFEKSVLEGGAETLAKIDGIQLELTIVPLYEHQALMPEMFSEMSRLGFKIWKLIPGYADPKTGRLLQIDGIFFRDQPH